MSSILTLTMNPTLDVSAAVENLQPGRKLRSETVDYAPGGGGINVARGITMLGGDACAVFTAGGAIGDMLEELMEASEVPALRVPIDAVSRQSFIVRVTENSNLLHFVLPGPELKSQEVDDAIEAVVSREPAPGYLVVSGSLPGGVDTDFYARLARAMKERDTRLVLDTHGEALENALEEPVFMVKPNQREFADLTGEKLENEDAVREAAKELVGRSSLEVLVVTLGEKGALLTTEDEQYLASPPRVDVVSPVGAGDSFLALSVCKLAGGASLETALNYGVAGAAAAVSTPGSDLFRPEDVERIYRQMSALREPDADE